MSHSNKIYICQTFLLNKCLYKCDSNHFNEKSSIRCHIHIIQGLYRKTYIYPYHASSFPIFHEVYSSSGCPCDMSIKCNHSAAHVINTTLVSDGYFTVAKPIHINHNNTKLPNVKITVLC